MSSLIRPMLYGAYHHMVNLTCLDLGAQGSAQVSTQPVHVVGPICESGDVLGYNRLLGPTQVADIILISHAGAYGRSMSSCYNLREPASEFF